MALRMHLNGGPRDDAYVETQFPVFVVAKPTQQSWDWAVTTNPMVATTTTGRYEPRRDYFGCQVPHNLSGWVEADWQGWRG